MADCIGYHEETCCRCGVAFQLTNVVYRRRLKDGRGFFCPNGHEQHYTRRETSEEKLKSEVSRLKSSLEEKDSWIEYVEGCLASERKSRAAYQGHYHRVQKAQVQA